MEIEEKKNHSSITIVITDVNVSFSFRETGNKQASTSVFYIQEVY